MAGPYRNFTGFPLLTLVLWAEAAVCGQRSPSNENVANEASFYVYNLLCILIKAKHFQCVMFAFALHNSRQSIRRGRRCQEKLGCLCWVSFREGMSGVWMFAELQVDCRLGEDVVW